MHSTPFRGRPPQRRWTSRVLLLLGLALLGYVSFAVADGKLFQAYESWRLNQTLESAPRARTPAEPQARTVAVSSADIFRAPLAAGSALGRIHIGRLGIDVIVAEGVDRRTLRRAVGHIPGTALPGEQGNVILTAHRDTFFRPLRHIRQGDEILLTTLQGSYRYRVASTQVVAPEDTHVLADTGEPLLTLVTCYPFYFVGPAPERFIVRAHLQ
jgi:sortase A